MSAVALRGVKKRFGKTEVLHGIDLDIADGEFAVFLGPSGCGKTTLLRLIAGLEQPSDGEIRIDGRSVNGLGPPERGIAMVFQSYALYPHMSVYKNMAFGLKMARREKHLIEARVRAAAKSLELDTLLERKPAQLSGGQRQRVAIGRAIVREPNVFLFDEPLSNLDAALRAQTRVEIAKLHNRLKTTMVYVTHDQAEAMTLADKIVVIDQGKIAQAGTALDLYRRPRNLFVASFIGSPRMNLLPARVTGASERGLVVNVGGSEAVLAVGPQAAVADARITIGVRPEGFSLSGSGDLVLAGAIEVVEHLGNVSHVHLRTHAGQNLVVATDGDTLLRSGEAIHVSVSASSMHVFAADGRALAADTGKGVRP